MTFGLPQIQRARNRRENERGVIERRVRCRKSGLWHDHRSGGYTAVLGHGRQERSALILGELQRVSEGAHGLRVRASSCAALQVAYALGAQGGARGQLLLRES